MPFSDAIRIGAAGAGDYEVERSLRFNDGDSANLTRTSSSTSTTFTYSAWIKRTHLSGYQYIFSMGNRGFAFHTTNNTFYLYDGSNLNESTAQFRDPSAWYHIVVQINSGVATSYVNGVLVHNAVGSGFTLTTGTNETRIGSQISTYYFDGYMAEINLVDGSVVAPSSFAETDAVTGEYKPKKYTGGYGTDGFYLNFSDNSGTTATTLGKDSSGNGNNFTPNNFGTGDAVKDSPTNNFCTFIGLLPSNSNLTLSQGNLFMDVNDSHKTTYGTHSLRSGKWYWEGRAVLASGYQTTKWTYGVSDVENTQNTQTTNTNYLLAVDSATYSKGDAVSIYNTNLYKNGSTVSSSYQTNPSAGDIIGIALDVDAGKVWFARNGTWINGSATASTTLNESSHDTTVTTGKVYTPAFTGESADWQVNFGQDSSFANGATAQGNTDGSGIGDFYYAVPSGFKAICTANLPDPTIALPDKHFDILTYTGDGGASRALAGLKFQPDLGWFKSRSGAANHDLYDSVRGGSERLIPNSSSGQNTYSNLIQSFNSDGYTLGTSNEINQNSQTFVVWSWKAGGSASSNSDGSTTSSVSANTSAGFSIVTYTGTGSTTTIGHGLGVAPKVVITKSRSTTGSWAVLHTVGDPTAENRLLLNDNGAYSSYQGYKLWNDTVPTSSVFTVREDAATNANTVTYVAYCFSEVAGYSKFGKYTGNGDNDGVFVHTGFKVKWLLIKRTSAEHWILADTARNSVSGRKSPADSYLLASANNAESTGIIYDMLSNGFKFRSNSQNESGSTYIYMAFAESPFKYARAR